MITDFSMKNRTDRIGLGDAVVLASIFAKYERVRWHVDPSDLNTAWHETNELFKHLYDLEIVPEHTPRFAIPGKPGKTFAAIALHIGAKSVRYKTSAPKEDYITTQTASGRDWTNWDITKHVNGMETFDLNNGKDFTVKEYFDKVAAAQKHIGVCSGGVMVSVACKVPTIMRAHPNPCAFCDWLIDSAEDRMIVERV